MNIKVKEYEDKNEEQSDLKIYCYGFIILSIISAIMSLTVT